MDGLAQPLLGCRLRNWRTSRQVGEWFQPTSFRRSRCFRVENWMVDELEQKFDNQEERRRHDRSRLIVDVFFNGQDATGVASTKDISLGGLYMNTRAEVPEGETLMVRIPIGKQEIVCSA